MKKKLIMSALALTPFLGINASAAGQSAVINYEYVNVRVSPGIEKSVSFMLKKGDKVEIVKESNGWSNIKFKNKTGWIQSSALKKVSDDKTVETYSNTGSTATVDSEVLNFRSAPTTGGEVIAVLKQGDRLKIVDESAGWTKVEFEGKQGYVSSRFISIVHEKKAENADTVMAVTSETLNMRKSTKATSEKVAELKKGDEVRLISSTSDGWSKVKIDGKEGYVSSYYLREIRQEIKESANTVDTAKESTPDESAPKNTAEAEKTSNAETPGKVNYVNMGMSLSSHVDLQLSKALNVDSAKGVKAGKSDLMKYMDPNNYKDQSGMMQFALINEYKDCITADQLNTYLGSYCKPGSVFYNQGQAFINAAKKNNINVLYLVAHSMIETGYGNSKLAKGVSYNGKTVYNFFGIGAVDGNALKGGAATAYKNGWTSVAAGIDGAASWIAQKYVHNEKYGQNTLYEMKWSPKFTWHQYASDIKWPSEIGKKMGEVGAFSTKLSNLDYEVPQYK